MYEGIELSEFSEGKLLAKDLLHDTRVILSKRSSGSDTWMRYNETQGRWLKMGASVVTSEAMAMIEQLYAYFRTRKNDTTGDPHDSDVRAFDYFKMRRVYSAAHQVASVAKLSKALHIDWEDIDAQPGLLNCKNCTLDLRGAVVTRLDHNPSRLITKRCDVAYDPLTPESKLWSNFLRQVLVTESGEPDIDLERWVKKLIGYIASGKANEEVVALFYGIGANGKNTLLDTISGVLGDYAKTTDAKKLVLTSSNNTDIYMADLQGARFVWAGEMPSNSKWNETAMKSLTQKLMKARHMRADPFEFEISHTVCFATNHLPSTTDRTPALWRRLKLIPFFAEFKGSEKDSNLGEKLRDEYTAILNWVLSGYELYKKEGLGTCVAGEQALGIYKEEQRFGTIAHFLEECANDNTDAYVLRNVLYDSYLGWCDTGNHSPESPRAFGQELRSSGYMTKRTMRDNVRAQYVFGLTLHDGRTVQRTGFGDVTI